VTQPKKKKKKRSTSASKKKKPATAGKSKTRPKSSLLDPSYAPPADPAPAVTPRVPLLLRIKFWLESL